jgi:CRP-like cAMP-binding protein
MDTLRKLIDAECGYRMQGETMDAFLGLMTEMKLKAGQPLIPYNTVDDNVYVIKEGIVRIAYFDGFNERTFAFGQPGTVAFSYYSFVNGAPSFNQFEACCNSVVMKVTKSQLMGLIRQSHDFAQWVIAVSLNQLMFYEKKQDVVNGTARERFEALMLNRPDIIRNVSSKILASYIGVTPIYFSKLKRDYFRKPRD